MKLTKALCKHHLGWQMKNLRRRKAVMVDYPCRVPQVLLDKGIHIVDPAIKPPRERFTPPVADDPRWFVRPGIEGHKDYKAESVYTVRRGTRLLEGMVQASILTKTQVHDGLPSSLKNLIEQVEIPNQDTLVQRYIMQSQVWDPSRVLLPRRIAKEKPGFRFIRQLGTPDRLAAELLQSNLLRLCQMLSAKFPSILTDRRLVHKHYLSVPTTIQGDKKVVICGHNEWLLSGNKPLGLFACKEEIDRSTDHTLPDIFPVAPTIDLQHDHCYKDQLHTGWLKDNAFTHPHTLFMINADRWSNSQRNAKALLYCFGYCLAQAQARYGSDVQTLPKPISIQCVNMNFNVANIVCFQLNTLDYSNDNGVKNMAWIDEGNKFFDKILPDSWLFDTAEQRYKATYDNYDSGVFQKILAVYLNGLPDFHKSEL